MKDSLILLIIGIIIGFGLCGMLSRCGGHQDAPDIDTVSVKVVHDSIVDTVPLPIETRKVGAVKAKLPLARKPDSCLNVKENLNETLNNDLNSPDSALVEIPIEQKVFTDSTNYRVVLSGYNVTLDTMQVFRHREYITERIKPPAKRWGLSVGIGAVVGTDMKVRPGIFVGATYTFLSF